MSDDVFNPEFWSKQRLRREAAEALEQDARIERVPRMARRNEPLSDDLRKVTVENVRRFLAHEKTITQARLAKMAGLSSSVMSDILRGRYRGDVDAALAKLEAAISDHYRRKDAPADPTFVKTRIAKRIFSIIKNAAKVCSIGVFYAPSGVGKTMAMEAVIAYDFPGGLLVKVNPACASPLTFCRELLRQAMRPRGVPDTIRTRAAAFEAIVSRLKDSGRLILIDEADGLHIETMNIVRQLHDATGCPIVLGGRPNLARKIDRTLRHDDIGGSFRGRVGIEHDLMADAQRGGEPAGERWLFSVDEVAEILAKTKLRVDPKGVDWLTMLANFSVFDGSREQGGLRYAVKVFRCAIIVARRPGRVTLGDIKMANTLTRDPDGAAQIAHQVDELLRKQRAG